MMNYDHRSMGLTLNSLILNIPINDVIITDMNILFTTITNVLVKISMWLLGNIYILLI